MRNEMDKNQIVIFLCGIFGLSHCIGAMLVTRYVKTVAPITADFLPCGVSAGAIDYCAARVTSNNTCEPLTRDWCDMKDISLEGSYFMKRAIVYMLEKTSYSGYTQSTPINLTDGSEVEIQFKMYNGCSSAFFTLKDDLNNIILRIRFWPPDKLSFTWNLLDNEWQNNKEYYNNNTASYDVLYTLRIVCGTNDFHINLNADYILTYTTGLPVNSITGLRLKFRDVHGDVYQVAYRF